MSNTLVIHFSRYNADNDTVTIVTDRCPYRGQNMDYARYLLTALYHESWRREAWELKEEPDIETFEVASETRDSARSYAECLENVLNKGEDENSLRQYKEEVRKLLNLPEMALKPEIIV
jgi:small subunit ribosomal protein S35